MPAREILHRKGGLFVRVAAGQNEKALRVRGGGRLLGDKTEANGDDRGAQNALF